MLEIIHTLRHPWKLLTILAIAVGIALGLYSINSFQSRVLLPDVDSYTTTGSFALNSTYPFEQPNSNWFKHGSVPLWGSWGGDDANQGHLMSNVFIAPPRLRLLISGYPGSSGNKVFLRKVDSGQTLHLASLNPGEQWLPLTWILPKDWQGQSIQLVAIDEASQQLGWFGVSAPLSVQGLELEHILVLLLFITVYIIHFCLFLLPGLAGIIKFKSITSFNKYYVLPIVILINAGLGYVTFWLYLLDSRFGILFSLLILLISLIYLIKHRSLIIVLTKHEDITVPLIITLLVGLLYLSLLYLYGIGISGDTLIQNRFLSGLPPDNIIPHLFAERLYKGQDPRNLIGDWLSSDRPPLQTGMLLIQRPWMGWFNSSSLKFQYQVLASIIQCSWIPSVWMLCKSLRFSSRNSKLVIFTCITSGFFLLNTLYTWPKLLAASLSIISVSLVLETIQLRRSVPLVWVFAASVSAALSMLAHGGVIFTLPILFVCILISKVVPGWRKFLLGLLCLTLFLLPWNLYQKLYEPPGDRLAKLHIAGVVEVDPRPLKQALIDSYSNLSSGQILANKVENFKRLFGDINISPLPVQERRTKEFIHVFNSLGWLNLSWLILVINLSIHRWKERFKTIRYVLALGVVSLSFWIMLMFGPGSTSIHHGSYATMILLFVGLSYPITQLSNWLTYLLLAVHSAYFFYIWIWTTPPSLAIGLKPLPQSNILLLLIILGIILCYKLLKSKNVLEDKNSEIF